MDVVVYCERSHRGARRPSVCVGVATQPSMGVSEGDVEAVGYQRRPACLVGGAAATPGLAVKELVEQEEVPPRWVLAVLLAGACVPEGSERLGETDGLRNPSLYYKHGGNSNFSYELKQT